MNLAARVVRSGVAARPAIQPRAAPMMLIEFVNVIRKKAGAI
jgi:hypothetical protein